MRLKNKSRRSISFSLAHKVVCEDGAGVCSCSPGEHRQRSHNPRTGDVGTRVIAQLIAGSVHLQPGTVSGNLRDSVKKMPNVAALLRRGELTAI